MIMEHKENNEMTVEEYRQAIIDECKTKYKDFCEKWPEEFEAAIKDWDERRCFESNDRTRKSISGMAYGLMMCI